MSGSRERYSRLFLSEWKLLSFSNLGELAPGGSLALDSYLAGDALFVTDCWFSFIDLYLGNKLSLVEPCGDCL